jgi:lactonase
MKRYFNHGNLLTGILGMASISPEGHLARLKKNTVPIPPDLSSLPTIKAMPWLQIEPDPDVLTEGPAFDREGNLYLTSILDGRIFRITPQKKVSVIFQDKNLRPTGSAFHRDGRLFITCISGEILAMNPDGSNLVHINARYQGKPQNANDLIFDQKGNLYVTSFSGHVSNPTGGVYRFSSDFTEVKPVLENLASPNGISFSPERNVFWVAETCRNAILRVSLLEDGVTISPIAGAVYVYYATGGIGGVDSNKVDLEGNLYQCLMFQGRALILNAQGIPLANVVIPGREEGKYLATSNLAFRPGTNEAFLLASGKGGAWIYTFRGLAPGLPLFSHQG